MINYKTNITGENNLDLFTDTLKIYPNPATNLALIDYSINNPGITTINLFYSNGIEMQKLNLGFQNSGEHSFNLPVSDLPNDSYYGNIQCASFIRYFKLIVNK